MTTPAQEATDAQMLKPLFVCGDCAAPVIVFNGRFFKTCEHLNSAILATPDAAKAVTNGN